MRFILLYGVLISLTSCEAMETSLKGHKVTCMHDVAYVQFPTGVTVMYDRNGKILLCNDPVFKNQKKK